MINVDHPPCTECGAIVTHACGACLLTKHSELVEHAHQIMSAPGGPGYAGRIEAEMLTQFAGWLRAFVGRQYVKAEEKPTFGKTSRELLEEVHALVTTVLGGQHEEGQRVRGCEHGNLPGEVPAEGGADQGERAVSESAASTVGDDELDGAVSSVSDARAQPGSSDDTDRGPGERQK